MQIKLLDDAQDDIAKGALFYEKQKKGLGKYFLDSIMSDIESLQLYAGIHFQVNSFLRLLSKRFPYAIYYKLENDIVYVYAVLDCRQNPIKTNNRLE